MIDIEKIQKQAEEIVSKLADVLENFKFENEGEYYILESKNVLRSDDEAVLDESFKSNALNVAPKTKDDVIIVEKSKWSQ
ncbi:Asp-tRNA(Asn)/Glu-tRNA(Gln) amidotransferase, subunit C, putative [Methanococcus vannielii SB]|jgi:aspartyl-tRNA(Asn)/glutamyl-tRNA(Gln) amidotransferase subunit C|uniref:Asp-tRNA(Asn)/Glu-tRNA(Gln) amidotransferase, subunit C, putative n=1 Tax=Methanococcus vannielii (strain ATCC 35089 / DSM 1224 / JCM 13029 / OCM 148 / SB) TaxID=406327 RepID=A6US70_METVS|nr:Asp-tRNA(Asn) amidotransferase subunit GatC [Methanococcus vannielii]ABR55342.1 Asp-tRNA(Asn)/Glu-tRNA(Gln) amidotransferase, subunit C, putative [Methanococcus vannielii SB]